MAEDYNLVKDVVYGKGGDIELKMDYLTPKVKSQKPLPAIVYIHYGGWKGDENSRSVGIAPLALLVNRGYFCATISYRYAPKYTYPAQIEDCKCAVRFLRAKAKEFNIDPDNIGAMGSSAGGHLSALLGATGDVKELEGTGGFEGFSSKVQAVAAFCGVFDAAALFLEHKSIRGTLIDFIGCDLESGKEKYQKASPVYYLTKNAPPFLVAHGDKDRVVPIRQSELLVGKLKELGIPYVYYPLKKGEHGSGGEWKIFWDGRITGEFFDKYLKK